MKRSLHASLGEIAVILGLSEAALYERQKALVRKGLLQKPIGRGRGAGADCTVENVSLLLATVLFSSSLSEIRDAALTTLQLLACDVEIDLGRDGAERGVISIDTMGNCSSGKSFIVTRTIHPSAIYDIAQLLRAN